MILPFRRRVHACIHPETYAYFVAPDQVETIWGALARRFGKVHELAGVHVRQIDAARMTIRASAAGNPITVIRKRRCADDDVEAIHEVLGFSTPSESS